MDGLTVRQLDAIGEVRELAERAGIAVWLRGGWAMDFHLGEVTRPHLDVDWYCWRRDASALATLLGGHGWRPDPRMPVERQLDLLRADVELSFAYLDRDTQGRVVVGAGAWAGTPLPEGMLDGPAGRIGRLSVAVIGVTAQIEFKEMYPVWMPDRPRRPKDAEDLARLRASLDPGPRR
ncbi:MULTISPECIES: nucleotidyltransferase domain-containing protein [unclassified Micromonospora]|uniref:nucleotidyltransferase domain-containing protein n=1 Tax=unclassified Micromonospora TaxID=2617518 RepID=UPI0013D31751|nr:MULTISPECIES: aminoglycoside adenylyltransferase [unclassified Micromonospora]NES15847.1 aminoglycoside adenylyltransferase [Micromonospora sp. PPF5-17B]NES57270.1 aminoglycoside adenylyltransferase [Micromonospora sp. PPF5-6]